MMMDLRFLAGGGTMGAMMRDYAWSASPLGHPESWPQPLKTLAAIILGAKQPMFAVWGTDKAMIYNDQYAEILGGHHPRALGQPFFDTWREIVDDVAPIMAKSYAGESVFMDDITLMMERHGFTEETHFSFSYTPVCDGSGEVTGVFCACTEITGQVLAERERVAELTRFRELFEQSPSFVAVLHGPDHVFELVNPSYTQLVGHRDVIGKPARDAIPEVAEQGFFDLLDTVYRTGTPFAANAMPISLMRAPGAAPEQRFLDLLYQPMRNADGHVVGIFANGNDVTAAWQADVTLQESEARNRQILDSAIDYAIIAADLDGLITRWNEGARRILGWDEADMLGQTAERFFTPEDRAAGQIGKEMRSARESGVGTDERWHLRRSGERFWASGEITVLRSESGQATGYVKVLRDRTEEHLAAQALAASQEQLERAQVAGGVGLFTLDIATGELTTTPAFCRIYGVDAAECNKADAVERLVLESDRHLVSTASARLTGQTPLKTQYRIKRANDGAVRWIARSAEFHHDALGHPIRMAGVVQDVTERHTTELLLRESEEQFRTLAQAIPNHAWTATPDGQLDWLNEQVATYSGMRTNALVGAGWTQLVHPDDLDRVSAAWRHSLASGDPYSIEFRIRRHDRTYRRHLVRALAARNTEGKITRWIGTNTDTEDQHAAREVLRHANSTLQEQVAEQMRERERIWNNSQDLLVIVGADGYFRDVNPAWTRILGFETAEVVGKHVNDLIYPEDNAITAEALHVAAHDVLAGFENRYRHKDGGFRWFSWTATHDDRGMVYANGRHMTEEKQARETLAATEDALRQAQKMEAVGQLTGGIAHDFNNLLQGIIGSLEIIKLRVNTGRYDGLDRFISGAMASANRAAGLTHRLLAFSRRQPLDPKPVKVNPLLTSIEDLLRRTLTEQIQLELVLAGGLWTTRCDPNQLESAILNLCINARDAMPDGGKLTIETCNAHLDTLYAAGIRGLAPGQYVCLCVTDTGTGMSKDVIDKAFEPFFTTKPIGQGTGLGLSMIYGFAKQSEGHVRLYSEVGKGTTVKLYLPRFRGESEQEATLPELGEQHLATERETVLVVEDEAIVRALIVEVLHELGYRALQAEDGPSGLAILQSRTQVDLLVTDIGLPGLNGRQLADAARLMRPELKILFMTGYAENAAFAHGFLEHGMEMITKPFPMELLAIRLRAILQEKP